MVPDLSQIAGIGKYTQKSTKDRILYMAHEHAFLVVNPHTIELRCDSKLAKLLMAKYESVMQSRYFGRGGIEIVPAGQLSTADLADLIRLSYNLTAQ